MEDSYYEEDTIMADFGKNVIDQYLGWCNKYGEPEVESGWPSFIKNLIDNFIEESQEVN